MMKSGSSSSEGMNCICNNEFSHEDSLRNVGQFQRKCLGQASYYGTYLAPNEFLSFGTDNVKDLPRNVSPPSDVLEYTCTVCDKEFSNKKSLKRHTNKFQGQCSLKVKKKITSDTLVCFRCNKVFSNMKNLKKHKNEFQGQCLCMKPDSSETFPVEFDDIVTQEKSICSSGDKGNCSRFDKDSCVRLNTECEKQWTATVNSSSDMLTCNTCNEKFCLKESLTRHIMTCTSAINTNTESSLSDRVPCTMCDKMFCDKNSLKRHQNKFQGQCVSKKSIVELSSDKPTCFTCGKTFSTKNGVRTHIIKLQGLCAPKFRRKVKCPGCQTVFCNKKSFRRHRIRFQGKCVNKKQRTLTLGDVTLPGRTLCISSEELDSSVLDERFSKKVKHENDESCFNNLSPTAKIGMPFNVCHIKVKPNSLAQHMSQMDVTSEAANEILTLETADVIIQGHKHTGKPSCKVCGGEFATPENLRRHTKIFEGKCSTVVRKKLLPCSLCNVMERNYDNLESHMSHVHSISIDKENLDFESKDDFMTWLKNIEISEKCKFIIRSTQKSSRKNISYYVCNRSGFFRSVIKSGELRKRSLQAQGSRKINSSCLARVTATYTSEGVSVRYCKTHTGHDREIQHLPISSDIKDVIAAKIAANIPIKEIHEDLQLMSAYNEIPRVNLITMQDLRNIAVQYGLNIDFESYTDNATNIELGVDKQRINMNNKQCILFYKRKGITLSDYPLLSEEDFALAVLPPDQQDILKRYGNSGCVVVDSINENNVGRFQLITLLTLDGNHQIVPCAFYISNRRDVGIEVFLEKVKETVGIISPKVIMTDMANIFFNSWRKVMGTCVWFFSSYHVVGAWQTKLHALIENPEKRKQVYKELLSLLTEPELESFHNIFHVTVNSLCTDEHTHNFGHYFSNNFSNNFHNWAHCYRRHVGFNKNLHLEKMHATLKGIYLNGSKVRYTLRAMLNLLKHEESHQLDNFVERQVANKITLLKKRHATAMDMDINNVWPSSEPDSWIVYKGSTLKSCVVTKTDVTNCICDLVCVKCKSCGHKFTCSCKGPATKNNMCSHMHLVCRYLNSENEEMDNDTETIFYLPVDDVSYSEEEVSGQIIVEQPEDIVITEDLFDQITIKSESTQSVNLEELKMQVIDQLSSVISDINNEEDLLAITRKMKS